MQYHAAPTMQGLLVVEKPAGCTSHDVVDVLRARAGLRRIGHTGTLDPMATGVLVLLIGAATRWAEQFLADDKEYETTIQLGSRTDTGDAWGKIIAQDQPATEPPTREAVEAVLRTLEGSHEQIPPMYSAAKHQGKPLYTWARRGQVVTRTPKRVHIYRCELLAYQATAPALAVGAGTPAPEFPQIVCRIHCSKGTYVRVLAETIGAALGLGAHVAALRRTRVGPFTLQDAVPLAWVQSATSAEIGARLCRYEAGRIIAPPPAGEPPKAARALTDSRPSVGPAGGGVAPHARP